MEYDEKLSSGRKIFDRINEVAVKNILDDWIKEVVLGLSGLIHVFDPPCVILGGGIMSQGYIIEKMYELLPAYLMPLYQNVKLIPAQLGNNTALLGAGHLASIMKVR